MIRFRVIQEIIGNVLVHRLLPRDGAAERSRPRDRTYVLRRNNPLEDVASGRELCVAAAGLHADDIADALRDGHCDCHLL